MENTNNDRARTAEVSSGELFDIEGVKLSSQEFNLLKEFLLNGPVGPIPKEWKTPVEFLPYGNLKKCAPEFRQFVKEAALKFQSNASRTHNQQGK